ncbi:MAG: substrate-binding domain-containing protein [Brevundimonas sp.]|uniref:substrate-binding domain-containing protein n=1 Tax=Brevundimonas sp. TaxID=1871086 RepID=UPI0039191591
MTPRTILTSLAAAALLTGCSDGASGERARTQIWAVGSSTVFPFTTRVAENFGRNAPGGAPRVESMGTGGGIQAFCAGIGPQTPDVASASRPMTSGEFERCKTNGVADIVEIKIGYDGIVVATARDGSDYDLRIQDLYLGLAKEVPEGAGFRANAATTWADVNPALLTDRIQVYGPPPTSGTRDAFLELGMSAGAEKVPALAALKASDEDRFEAVAHTLREDGHWIDSGENDNAIVQTLTRTPRALGVFGFSFLNQNASSVKAASIDGVMPSIETIADGSYPLARSMFIYVKKAHIGVTPGLQDFVREYLSDGAMAPSGYLADRGMIPLRADDLAAQRALATSLTPMTAPSTAD